MPISELLKQYDKEWLLIKVHKFDENWEPVEGEVIFHSPSDAEVGREMLKHKGEQVDFTVLYAGEEAEEIAVLI